MQTGIKNNYTTALLLLKDNNQHWRNLQLENIILLSLYYAVGL